MIEPDPLKIIRSQVMREPAWFPPNTNVGSAPPTCLAAGRHSGFSDEATTNNLSVVIAVYGQLEHTIKCLQSLRAHAPGCEIIVVDNGSQDYSAKYLASQADVRLISWAENRGVATAWNAGITQATRPYLCILNNDTIVQPGGMEKLIAVAKEGKIGCLRMGLIGKDGKCIGFTSLPSISNYPEGSCLVMHRRVIEAIGLFDETFFPAYSEDSDWGVRAQLKGYTWRAEPDAVIHVGQQTSKTIQKIQAYALENEKRLLDKWGHLGLGQHVLIRRSGAIGDVVIATAPIMAWKRKYPLAKIYLLTSASIAPLFENSPWIDFCGSKFLINSFSHVFDLDWTYERQMDAGHIRHPALIYAHEMGVALSGERYHVSISSSALEWAKEQLAPFEGKTLVACGLRSAGRSKANWSATRWLELFRSMPDCVFILFDGEPHPYVNAHPENGSRDNVLMYMAENVVNLTGEVPDLPKLAACLSLCDACVSVDTGILHLADAVGCNTVALIAGTSGWAVAPLSGSCVVLQGQADCYPCNMPARCARTDGKHCLDWVSGDLVAHNLQRVISGKMIWQRP